MPKDTDLTPQDGGGARLQVTDPSHSYSEGGAAAFVGVKDNDDDAGFIYVALDADQLDHLIHHLSVRRQQLRAKRWEG